jgi:hypothetical protein
MDALEVASSLDRRVVKGPKGQLSNGVNSDDPTSIGSEYLSRRVLVGRMLRAIVKFVYEL